MAFDIHHIYLYIRFEIALHETRISDCRRLTHVIPDSSRPNTNTLPNWHLPQTKLMHCNNRIPWHTWSSNVDESLVRPAGPCLYDNLLRISQNSMSPTPRNGSRRRDMPLASLSVVCDFINNYRWQVGKLYASVATAPAAQQPQPSKYQSPLRRR